MSFPSHLTVYDCIHHNSACFLVCFVCHLQSSLLV